MAEATLLDMQLRDGRRLIDRLAEEGVPVTAAAWVKEDESGDWYLYLVTPLVGDGTGKKAAYHSVNEVVRQMEKEGFGLDPHVKKVIGPEDPIAKDLVAHRKGSPSSPPRPFHGSRFGDLAVDEAYIYPRLPTPEEEVGMQLWERGNLELKPGIGPAGLCRVVVIDIKNQVVTKEQRYRDTIRDPQPLAESQVEVTWTEGGKVRIVETGSHQRWEWSQPRATWAEGGCAPGAILRAVFAAIG